MSPNEAKLVNEQAYDDLATWYLSWIENQPSPRERYALKLLQNHNKTITTNHNDTTTTPHILELGCGPGVPVTRLLLSQGARVHANDISRAQIALAKTLCASASAGASTAASFSTADMTTLRFPPSHFSGAACFFTLFHLPRAEQGPMLRRVHGWLKPGGVLVCNFATVEAEAIWGEMMGRGIFWSGFGVEGSLGMVRGAGFEVVESEVLGSEADGGNEFLWVVARKGVE